VEAKWNWPEVGGGGRQGGTIEVDGGDMRDRAQLHPRFQDLVVLLRRFLVGEFRDELFWLKKKKKEEKKRFGYFKSILKQKNFAKNTKLFAKDNMYFDCTCGI
jgi:hypothetical protein